MKFPVNKNTLALCLIGLIITTFFTAGLFDALNDPLIQGFLCIGFTVLLGLAIWYAVKNDQQKNRPEDKLQDDSD